MSTAPVITIFVRHNADCKYAGDEFCKRCNCRKHLRYTLNGVQVRQKANTRSWSGAEEAKSRLQYQLSGKPVESVTDSAQLISAAVIAFITDKEVSDVSDGVRDRYERELDRFRSFCEASGVFTVQGITPALITSFKTTWSKQYKSTFTRANVQKRLLAFLKFCLYNGWLPKVPKLAPVKITETPTQPITDEQYDAVLKAVPQVFPNGYGHKVRAVIKLMRWSGLSVRDASGLRRDELDNRGKYFCIRTQRQKMVSAQGTDKAAEMYIPIPPDLGRELMTMKNAHPDYVFWEPRKSETSQYFSHNMSVAISQVFAAAGIQSGHMVSHRLRDTYAVDLLSKGVPMEEVSKLLGHSSIVITERHYAKWAKGRQDRVDDLVSATWEAH